MKYTTILSLAAVSSAFVLPSEQVFADIEQEKDSWYEEAISVKDNVLSSFKKHFDEVTESTIKTWDAASKSTYNAIDEALEKISETSHAVQGSISETAFDVNGWLESELSDLDNMVDLQIEHHGVPLEEEEEDFTSPPSRSPGKDGRHHGPPPPPGKDGRHHGPPPPDDGEHHGRPGRRPPHHKRPHRRPHHGHGKPNATVYELIANSKYTTKLAALINEYSDLVDLLNSTKANYTVFAPTDRAFAKIPDHAPKPSKQQLKDLLSYHIVPEFYPAGRVLVTHTVPTLLPTDELGDKPLPQRLRLHVGLNGLTVNFYSHIVAVDIFGTNGVIHGVDSIILPPPSVVKIVDLLPGTFSTLELGLGKTGLLEKLNTTKHEGGTLFAPSNNAFARLGPRANAFLFSEHGLKYLKALLEYHVVPKNTLYSDAFYSADAGAESIPRGRFHVDLPTMLKDRSLSVDIARFGGFITIKINGFNRVAVQDGIAADGVIHVVPNVLIPPRHLATGEAEWTGEEEIEVEDLKQRLAPYMPINYDL